MKVLWLVLILSLIVFAAYLIWIRYLERQAQRRAAVKTLSAAVRKRSLDDELDE